MTDSPYMPVKAKSDEWQTPRALFDALDEEFGPFTLDPACRHEHYTAQRIWERGGTNYVQDWPADAPRVDRVLVEGLTRPWFGRVFLNPPYPSKSLYTWSQKAVSEIAAGNCELVCAVLPVKSEQPWWQEFVCKEASYDRLASPAELMLVRFLPKRQRYVGAGNAGATFPSAVVVWRA